MLEEDCRVGQGREEDSVEVCVEVEQGREDDSVEVGDGDGEGFGTVGEVRTCITL